MSILNIWGVEGGAINWTNTDNGGNVIPVEVASFLDAGSKLSAVTAPLPPGGSHYSMKVNAPTVATYVEIATANANASFAVNDAYLRFYVRFDTLPGADWWIACFRTALANGGTVKLQLGITSAGKLKITDAGAVSNTGTTVLATGVWYRIEVHCGSSATVGVEEVLINGATEISVTGNTSATQHASITLGSPLGSASSGLCYIDDLEVRDSGYPGAGVVICLRPRATGNQQWPAGTGGLDYLQVRDIASSPPTDGTGSFVGDSTNTNAFSVFNEVINSRIGSGYVISSINCVKSIAVAGSTGGGVNTGIYCVKSDGTFGSAVTWALPAVAVNVAWIYIARLDALDPHTGSAWQPVGVNGSQVGIVNGSAGTQIDCTLMAFMVSVVLGTPTTTPPPGTNWISRVAPIDLQYVCVAWAEELEKFVALSFGGMSQHAISSPDGITWTDLGQISTTTNWTAILWISELALFVAIGSNTGSSVGYVATSPDGITWTTQTPASNTSWWALAWSPQLQLIVAVSSIGSATAIMTSPDGVTWTSRTPSSVTDSWTGVAWSQFLGLFVVLGQSHMMTSPDGITWTSQTIASTRNWNSLCWAPALGKFVAVASSGDAHRVQTSPDGIVWTAQTVPATYAWYFVIFVPVFNTFVCVAADSTSGTFKAVMTSPDGITWTLQNTPELSDITWQCVTWSPSLGRLVATSVTAGVGNEIMTSDAGNAAPGPASPFILTNTNTAGGSGFFDLPDSVIGAGVPVYDDDLIKMNETAKFAAVRYEMIFMGYYKHGAVIKPPISPVDGYQYAISELQFEWLPFSTRGTDANFVDGQAGAPGIGFGLKTGQQANLYWYQFDIDDSTGKVSTTVSYFAQGAVPENITNDGVVKVLAACQRASLNLPNEFGLTPGQMQLTN